LPQRNDRSCLMDFALSEEQTAIFDMARDFGATHIAPFAREWEVAGEIPKAFGSNWRNWALAGSMCAKKAAERA